MNGATQWIGKELTAWLVEMSVTARRGDKAETVRVEVPQAHSEASAIRVAFLRHFGGTNRTIHNLEMVRVARR